MSTNHESQSFYIENEKELRHATRLNQVNFITNTVAAGAAVGTAIALVLYITLGNTIATGTGTILGGIMGGLIGAIFLWVKRRRPDAEPPQSL